MIRLRGGPVTARVRAFRQRAKMHQSSQIWSIYICAACPSRGYSSTQSKWGVTDGMCCWLFYVLSCRINVIKTCSNKINIRVYEGWFPSSSCPSLPLKYTYIVCFDLTLQRMNWRVKWDDDAHVSMNLEPLLYMCSKISFGVWEFTLRCTRRTWWVIGIRAGNSWRGHNRIIKWIPN